MKQPLAPGFCSQTCPQFHYQSAEPHLGVVIWCMSWCHRCDTVWWWQFVLRGLIIAECDVNIRRTFGSEIWLLWRALRHSAILNGRGRHLFAHRWRGRCRWQLWRSDAVFFVSIFRRRPIALCSNVCQILQLFLSHGRWPFDRFGCLSREANENTIMSHQ